jgi:3-oxoacyl-[acyl-carrier-protein] synthase II
VHPGPRSSSTGRSRRRATSGRWSPGSGLGTYAAGLAIDDAGARGLVAEMDLIVAAGGGGATSRWMRACCRRWPPCRPRKRQVRLNEMLAGGLRPTLFLAQLSNLLAGNISIVHGVTGASRSLMGEEQAGADAVRVAAQRLAEGRGNIALAGGGFVATRWDLVLLYNAGGLLRRGPWAPVFSRDEAPGAIPGTFGAFPGARDGGKRAGARRAGPRAAQHRRLRPVPAQRGTIPATTAPAQAMRRLAHGCRGLTAGDLGLHRRWAPTVLERRVPRRPARPLAAARHPAAGSAGGWRRPSRQCRARRADAGRRRFPAPRSRRLEAPFDGARPPTSSSPGFRRLARRGAGGISQAIPGGEEQQ